MEIKDVILHGDAWVRATEELKPIFASRTHYQVFMLSISIGIMYDQRIAELESTTGEPKQIGRNVFYNYDNGKLDFMFQAAILSTTTENFSEKERLELAFDEKSDFSKLDFLIEYANFGVTKLVELIADTPLETMENIKNFLVSTVEGRNLDVDGIPEDYLILGLDE